ncbi:MAG: class I SAM-dependent methyltransferase [Thermoanaerobaculia bacterium]
MATTILDAAKSPFDSWALDVFYRGFFEDPILREFYGGSGYANLGYWDSSTETAVEACDRLVDRLVDLLGHTNGSVLDVACGVGATTRRLLTHFDADEVSAINISPPQIAEARKRAPGASFYRMDAAAMEFPDSYFDHVVCVEAAFHFRTRRRFLEEAFRVLKPGGSIAVSDLLMLRGAPTIPWANYLPDLGAYEDLLAGIGFERVHVEPALEETWEGFRKRFTRFISANSSRNGWAISSRDRFFTNVTLAAMIRNALLASAQKP